MRPRSALGTIAFAVGLAGPATARAQTAARPAQVDLTYERSEAAAACPDARAFAAAVAGRLGYEPFQSGAPRRMKVTVDRRERTFDARVELTEPGGARSAERRFTSRATDCAELAATTELALAIAIDPFHSSLPAPPPTAAAPPPAPAPLPPAPAPTPATVVVRGTPPVLPGRPVLLGLAAGVVGAIGSAPADALGLEVRGGARRGDFSLALEGRANFTASTAVATGSVSATLLAASLVPCAHWRSFAACALATAGVLRAAGHGLVDARQSEDPWFAVGARLAAELPIHGTLALAAHADAVAPLVQTELKVGGASLWTTPPVAFAAGVGLAVAFR